MVWWRKNCKIIEKNKDRAEFIANELNNTIVINGDGLDEDVLKEANIEEAETILSLTNDDEDNIMVSVLAEKNNPNKNKTDILEKDTKEASSEINLPQIPGEKLDSKTTLEIDNDKNKAREKNRINAEKLERAIKEISLKLDSPLPQMPNVKLDSKTVLGIDSNENGMRDVNEIIIYQGLNLLIDDKKIYYKVLRLIDMIEPASEEIIPNSKDEHEIYCSYKKLPSIVQKELPLRLIYSVVFKLSEL